MCYSKAQCSQKRDPKGPDLKHAIDCLVARHCMSAVLDDLSVCFHEMKRATGINVNQCLFQEKSFGANRVHARVDGKEQLRLSMIMDTKAAVGVFSFSLAVADAEGAMVYQVGNV